MELTTCDVSAIPEAVICQMHAKEIIRLQDNGLEIRKRCSGQSRQPCVKIKMMLLTGSGLRTRMSSGRKV